MKLPSRVPLTTISPMKFSVNPLVNCHLRLFLFKGRWGGGGGLAVGTLALFLFRKFPPSYLVLPPG
jgi:hypothetical protein